MGCVNMTDVPPVALARVGQAFAFKTPARAAATINVNLPTASLPMSVDGVALQFGDEVLLTGQTAPAQNGLYTLGTSGSELVSGSYDASGFKDITGLSQTLTYYFVKGNATSAAGATTITETGIVVPDGTGRIRLLGTPLGACTASVKLVLLSRDPSLDASAEFAGANVRVLEGTANKGTWQYTGIANPILGTTALPWTKASSSSGSAVAPPLTPPAFTNTPPGALDPCAVPPA